jgi:hypothetical protein
VESAVNEIIAKRMNKKQQMRWNRTAVQCSATSRLDTRRALRKRLGLCFPRPQRYCQRARSGQAQAADAEAFGLA